MLLGFDSNQSASKRISLTETESLLFNQPITMLPENPWQTRPTSAIEATLNTAELPPIYEKAFRIASPKGGKVTLAALNGIVGLGGLPPSTNEKIINMCINPGDLQIPRNTFKLVLTLVALAQKNMDISFENVQLYLKDLPTPSLPGLDSFSPNADPFARKGLLPALPINSTSTSSSNALKHLNDPWQQTSFGEELPFPAQNTLNNFNEESSNQDNSSSLINSTLGVKSIPPSLTYNAIYDSPLDTITIHPHDQLEGFIFKHLNYVLYSARYNTRVLRRYSEFNSLYYYLTGKYTYRLIPDIPPKRIGVNDVFLEKRRKGLLRFMNFICNHPVISNDETLKIFVTNSDEHLDLSQLFSNATKENEIEVGIQAHLKDNISPDYLTNDVPEALEVFLDQFCLKLKSILSHYSMLIQVTEKISKQISADSNDLAELSKSNTRPGSSSDFNFENSHPSDIYSPEQELPFLMLYLQKLSVLMGANSDSITNNVVEVTKGLRDVVSGFIKLITRSQQRTLIEEDRIQKRIRNNKLTLNYLSKEPGADKAELERLKKAIEQDKLKLSRFFVSERLIRRTIWNEYQLYRDFQVRTTTQMIQNLVNDQIKACNLSAHNWKALADQLSHMV